MPNTINILMLKSKLSNRRIILASGSPRRQELLKQLDIPFKIYIKPVDESFPLSLRQHQISDYLAQKKAHEFDGELQNQDILITSDTIVWLKEKALGKPSSRNDALEMLNEISGQTHEVITSICLTSVDKQHTDHAVTKVTFKNLSSEEIKYYIDHFNPMDKAGAYGIQDWIGQIGITGIQGSYYNVMGFPMDIVYKNLLVF